MEITKASAARVAHLVRAFDRDGYAVDTARDVVVFNERVGIRATHRSATIGRTGKHKPVYYLEGDPFTMGYLLGRLAANDVKRVSTTFVNRAPFAFINPSWTEIGDALGAFLKHLTYLRVRSSLGDIPYRYHQELAGLIQGCQEARPPVSVDAESLWVLNAGIDALLTFAYTGDLFALQMAAASEWGLPAPIEARHLRIPILCNGFSAAGRNPLTGEPYHFLGRDFQFVTADVFQDTVSMIIRKPDDGLPTVSVAAPGVLGTIAGLNLNGVGIGVDMAPGINCSPSRPGINSTLLTRHCIEKGGTFTAAVDVLARQPRGVTWDYLLADGQTGQGGIVEAGRSEEFDAPTLVAHVAPWVRATIPDLESRLQRLSAPYRDGIMVRGADYAYPREWADLNAALITAYARQNPSYSYRYDPADFRPEGYLNQTREDRNCPGPYYFAPPRQQAPGVVLVTNQFITPEMRLWAMNDWIAEVAGEHFDDIQWRYDELNHRITSVLAKGYLTKDEARATIDFLAPSSAPDAVIGGSVSLMDLREKTIESHYGYYGDEWIKLTLPAYIGD